MPASFGPVANYAPFIGLRYSFSRKRQRFTTVIAMVSMLGMVIGVASLIAVLSVMNGFAGELRGRILALVPHGYVESRSGGIADWEALRESLLRHPGIVGAAPYISDKVILGSGEILRGAVLTAIDPQRESDVSNVAGSMIQGSLAALDTEPFGIVLGSALARIVGVGPGDQVKVTVPRLTVTPLGVFPRSKRLTVVGLFEVGAQPDAYQAYVSLALGQKLLGESGRVDGLQVRTTDMYRAPEILPTLADSLGPDFLLRDWSQTQGSLFRAVRLEKLMVSLLLLSVVAVAAFNIVSTLVMSVAEKRRDIAVLRTMGARSGGVMAIFVAHGLVLAGVGVSVGAVIGVLLARYISDITSFVEGLFGVRLFDPTVYFISALPSELRWPDVVTVVIASLLLGLLATLYPAWRASRIAPAEVLRYE